MRKLLCLGLLLANGCCACEASRMGWEFRVNKAAAVMVPAVISPQSTGYGISPIAAYPSAPPGGPAMPLRAQGPLPCEDAPLPSAAPLPRRARSFEAECCERILKRLDALDSRLDTLPPPRKLEQ